MSRYLERTLLSPRWQWLNRLVGPFVFSGGPTNQWLRQVMNRETAELVDGLRPETLSALEVSGTDWGTPGRFRSYRSAGFPEYDVCGGPLPGETFDLVIAEQVFEHLLWPYRAGRSVHAMLNPGGHFLVTVPFLVKVHPMPHDCTRWTETGLRYFLAECGFPLDGIVTGSWGNRACVAANFKSRWVIYRPRWHSLRNEPDVPVVTWALARK